MTLEAAYITHLCIAYGLDHYLVDIRTFLRVSCIPSRGGQKKSLVSVGYSLLH